MKTIVKKITYLVVISFLFVQCTSSDKPVEQGSDAAVEQSAMVRTAELDYSSISRNITYSASLRAYNEVHLASASPGRIEKIHVEASDRIRQGQLLVEMDRTQLHQAEVQLKNLEVEYRRLETLRETGNISQQQYDQMKTQYEVAKTNVAFLRENTRLQAPFPGVVSGKYFEDGEMYSGAPNTAAGKSAILSLMQINQLKATVNVAERFFPQVHTGMKVELSSDVYPNETFDGLISRVYPQIDPATRTFRIEVTIPNSHEKLRPGMFARATLDLEQVDAFVVPAMAVLKVQGTNERYLFVNNADTAERVIVEIGNRYDDQLEVISDRLKPGDQLIVAGHRRLLNGQPVVVQQ